MKKIFLKIAAVTLALPTFVYADTPIGPQPPPSPTTIDINIPNPFKGGTDLTAIVTSLLNNVIMPLAAVFIVVMIIYSGFKYLTAQGKPDAIKEANKGLMYVLIGAAVLLGASAISAAVQGTFNQLMQ